MKTLEVKQINETLPPKLKLSDTVALDLELTGLKENQIHRPYGTMLSLACSFDGETAYIIYDEGQVIEFLENIKDATWIFHNAVFDLGHLRRWASFPERKNLRDTLLIEKLMWSGYYEDFGLNDLVRRYLKCYMDKSVRAEFSDHNRVMTTEQKVYAAKDVVGTWLVDKEQQKIVQPSQMKMWNLVDLPTVWAVLDFSGFKIDVDKWTSMAMSNQEKADSIESTFSFNPASPKQVLEELQRQGVNVSSTGDDIIAPYREKNDTVSKILDYRKYSKRASTYGIKFIDFVEQDGRIHPSFNVIGAETGRLSCGSPNLQNQPHDKEYRECYIPDVGNKLIIADYSAQEPRIFAQIVQDEKLTEILRSGKDIYIEVAKEVFKEEITKQDPRRSVIKALLLGIMYGISPFGFAKNAKISQEDAEQMMADFFQSFPQIKQHISRTQSKNPGIVKSILGRVVHLHPYNHQWKRNALNAPIQGTAADMTKLAVREFGKQWGSYAPIVVMVHDEIVLEVPEADSEKALKVLVECMISVAQKIHPDIPAKVSACVANDWSEKP